MCVCARARARVRACACVCACDHSVDRTIMLRVVVRTVTSPVSKALFADCKIPTQLQHFARPANSRHQQYLVDVIN